MNLELIFEQLNKDALGWGVIVIAILSCIQIAPIKLNPWSFIAKQLGRALMGESCHMMSGHMDQIDGALKEITTKVIALENKLVEAEDKADMDRAIIARVRILRFNDEILGNKRHSKESFDQALEDIDNYESYCRSHPNFRNNKTVMSVRNIKNVYERQLATNDFLVNGTNHEHE